MLFRSRYFAGARAGVAGAGVVAGAGAAGAGVAAGVVAGAEVCAGAEILSKMSLPGAVPVALVPMTDSDNEVIMNTIAEIVVARVSTVAEPRGPNTVCEPMPPKAPARSAALPLCSSTTMIKNTDTITWMVVKR